MTNGQPVNHYSIIGMGAAGVAAALTIRQRDPASNITIATNDQRLYYSRPGLAYLLAGEIPDKQLTPFPEKFFHQLRIKIIPETVDSIDLTNYRLILESKRIIPYDKLLLATGAQAVMPDIPGIQLDGVVKLDNYADAQKIIKAARRTRSAVVVGGGITALELVEGLIAQGVTVHYFLRGERYWSGVLDEVESRIVERRLFMEGVKIHYFTNLAEVVGKKGKVAGIQAVENGQNISYPCQMVAVAIGIRPRTQLAVKAGLKTNRGILVDPYLRTNEKNVFAAGDVAQVFDRDKGEYLLDSLWNPAIEMGRVAGANMAGASLIYEKKFPFNVTRLAGLVTTIIGQVGESEKAPGTQMHGDLDVVGIMRGDSEVWRLKPNAVVAQTYNGDNRLRLYINGKKLVGAVVMGDQTLSRPIQRLIQGEVDILSIRENLLSKDANLPVIIDHFWEAYSHAAKIT